MLPLAAVYLPTSQLVQEAEPATVEIVPVPHGEQAAALSALYCPALQLMHAEKVALGAYFPAKHVVQLVLADVPNFPAGHAVQ